MASRLSDADLDELAFLNFTESLREFVRWSPGGVLEENGDTLRTRTSVDFASGSFNAATHLGAGPVSPSDWLAEQVRWFSAHHRGFSVHTRDKLHDAIAAACISAGFAPGARPPVMSRRAPFMAPEALEGKQVRVAASLADWQRFVDITATSYVSMGFPEHITRALMSSPSRMQRRVWHCALASDGGIDSAAALALFSHSIAGLYWVGTLPRARNRGLAAACVQFLTNHAFELGARAVVLQASEAGAPLYRRLGFEEFTQYPMYVFKG